ncbi:hypothetical protein SAMN05878503_10477 [Cereibacter ovatus]|uniref:Succinate dehydrogenase n=1 Tax=Cereibacter ovatus TaxID=439529 RepID=A0A285CRB7_9RHOB|nr:hypothetical protein [Cereibacter ovatus]SNX69513.1 hypothetical protein SAMN05878503_10477 [Cereibacter ovatus]
MRAAVLLSALVLAACNPQDVADSVGRKAARTVVVPVVQMYLPDAAAEGVATCIVQNATADEVKALARDIGVRAGTSTVRTVQTIAARPETVRCLRTSGLPLLPAV